MEAMVEAACAGPSCSHDRPNVLWKIDRLVSGDPDAQFGLTGLNSFTPTDVLGMVAIEAGFDPDPRRRRGEVPIDPWRVLAACDQAGKRAAEAAGPGGGGGLGTRHPAGPSPLYLAGGRPV